jgi:short-subunit dehydrogenase
MSGFENQLYKCEFFKGKTILVTGATNGIGRALVLLLRGYCASIIAHGRSQSRLDSLSKSFEMNKFVPVLGDLKEKKGWRAVESIIIERQPDILVLNAGYNCRKQKFLR